MSFAGKPKGNNEAHRDRDTKLERLVDMGFSVQRAAEMLDSQPDGAYTPRDTRGGSPSGPRRANPRYARDPRPRGRHGA